MKVRIGFVSNSSSSTFLVMISRDVLSGKDKRFLLTKKEIGILKANGFKRTHMSNPHNLDYGREPEEYMEFVSNGEDYQPTNMYKHVSCNQGDVADILFKHKIPFIASISYGHQTWVYERGKPYFTVLQNLGLNYSVYKELPTFEAKEAIKRVKVKDYLEGRH